MKNYLVVGTSKGIGKAVAELLLENGHIVYGLSRNKNSIFQHKNFHFFEYNVLDEIPPPILDVPLAGIIYLPGSIRLKPFHRIKDQEFLEDFNLNVLGAIRIIRYYLPQLKQSDNASIVLMSTVAAQRGMPFHSSVAISKSAIEGLMLSLAAELAPQIRVNVVAPSLTDTPLSEKLLNTDEKRANAAARHPLKRIGSADVVSKSIYFLLENEWMTGQVIGVDGGLSTLSGG